MHIGLSDMAVFRYAKDWKYGLYSAFGMFPGHMLAWICSGVMVAGVNRQMNPGLMAFEAAGVAGVMAVAIAGWTTANPTLYRAGLALQSVTPNWPRWKITLAAGAVTSVLSCFPVFFMKLLDYVAIYGLILMPMGAIVLVEHWVLPRIGVEQYVAERRGAAFNWNALLVWVGTLALAAVLPMHLFFRWLPCFFVAIVAYTVLQYMTARRNVAAEARA
jgi:purine-cytosine permease-like protein